MKDRDVFLGGDRRRSYDEPQLPASSYWKRLPEVVSMERVRDQAPQVGWRLQTLPRGDHRDLSSMGEVVDIDVPLHLSEGRKLSRKRSPMWGLDVFEGFSPGFRNELIETQMILGYTWNGLNPYFPYMENRRLMEDAQERFLGHDVKGEMKKILCVLGYRWGLGVSQAVHEARKSEEHRERTAALVEKAFAMQLLALKHMAAVNKLPLLMAQQDTYFWDRRMKGSVHHHKAHVHVSDVRVEHETGFSVNTFLREVGGTFFETRAYSGNSLPAVVIFRENELRPYAVSGENFDELVSMIEGQDPIPSFVERY